MAEQRTAFGCSRVSESRPAVGQVLAVCLFLGGLAACSGEEQRPAEDPPVSCVSGRETGCTCADGRLGSQVCASDGRSWSSCRCEGAEGEGEGAEGEGAEGEGAEGEGAESEGAEGEGAEGEGAEGEGAEGEGAGPCLDEDGDRYGVGEGCLGPDCREGDPFAHPGAAERCNGRDDDCDGQPDLCECTPYLGTAECPAGQYCLPTGEPFLARCVDLPTGEVALAGQDCSAHVCTPGTQCIRQDEGPPRCLGLCDPHTREGCTLPEVCWSVLVANRDIGLCKLPPPLCDVYDSQSCPAGEACRPLLHSSGFAGTVCRPAGVRGAGEACDDDADPCLPGLICITYADSGDKLCRRTCQEHADCPAGEGACLGQTLSLGITFCY